MHFTLPEIVHILLQRDCHDFNASEFILYFSYKHFTILRTEGVLYIKNWYSSICASHVHDGFIS